MGVPQTLPRDFQGFDPPSAPPSSAPATLPANFSGWDESAPAAPKTLPANFSGWDEVAKYVDASKPWPRILAPLQAQTQMAQATNLPQPLAQPPTGDLSLTLGPRPRPIPEGLVAERAEQLGHAPAPTQPPPALPAFPPSVSPLAPTGARPLTPSPTPQVPLATPAAPAPVQMHTVPLVAGEYPEQKYPLGSMAEAGSQLYGAAEQVGRPMRQGAEAIQAYIRYEGSEPFPDVHVGGYTVKGERVGELYNTYLAPAGIQGAEFLKGLYDPINLLLLGALSSVPATGGGLAFHRAINAYFAGSMGIEGVKEAYQSYQAAEQGEMPLAVSKGLNAAFNLGMAGAMAAGPGKGYIPAWKDYEGLPQEPSARTTELFRNLAYKYGASVPENPTYEEARGAFRRASANIHPDTGSTAAQDFGQFTDLWNRMRESKGWGKSGPVSAQPVAAAPTPTPAEATPRTGEELVPTEGSQGRPPAAKPRQVNPEANQGRLVRDTQQAHDVAAQNNISVPDNLIIELHGQEPDGSLIFRAQATDDERFPEIVLAKPGDDLGQQFKAVQKATQDKQRATVNVMRAKNGLPPIEEEAAKPVPQPPPESLAKLKQPEAVQAQPTIPPKAATKAELAQAVAQPGQGGGEQKVYDFLGNSIERAAKEAVGQGILDDMAEQKISPADVARQFWEHTYFNLPAEAQGKFRNYLQKETSFKPGDTIGFTANKQPIIARDWIDIATQILDVSDDPEDLEGTTRGLVALMKVANDRFGAAGKPVPAEVLKDYPELAGKAQTEIPAAKPTPPAESLAKLKPAGVIPPNAATKTEAASTIPFVAPDKGAGEKSAQTPHETPAGANLTKTPEFRRWFAASKITDESGQPLRVFHGTQSQEPIVEWDTSDENSGNTQAAGTYFARDPKIASEYGEGKGGHVHPVYLSIEYPFVGTTQDFYREYPEFIEHEDTSLPAEEFFGPISTREHMIEKGYDGQDAGWQIIAFYPEQIRSALRSEPSPAPSAGAEPAGEKPAAKPAKPTPPAASLAKLKPAGVIPPKAASNGAVAPGEIGKMKTSALSVAPHKFQYKLSTDTAGTSSLLKETKVYNPDLAGVITIWRDPADGKYYVVNGHHRYELAVRTGTQEVAVRHIIAKDAAEARAIGALQNIAEGRGTAVDAAKFFRDTGLTIDDLKAKGISLGETTAKEGIALSQLVPELFNRVVSGTLGKGRAVAIGEATPDHAEQKAILSLVEKKEAKGTTVTNATLSELIRLVKGAEKAEETTADLFGTQQVTKSLALEKAEISSYIKQQLAKDKKLFGFVAKQDRATELARAGNKIEVEKSKEISTQAAQAEEVYNKLSERGGPIGVILDEAARRLAKGDNAGSVKTEAYQRVRTEVSKTLGGSEGPGAGRPENPSLYSPENAPVFYSKAARVAFDKLPGAASGDSILATLKNAGVKDEEIKWIGLDDLLKGKPKATKADVLSYIMRNMVQIRETTLGQRTPEQAEAIETAKGQRDVAEQKFRTVAAPLLRERLGLPDDEEANHLAGLIVHEIVTGSRSSGEVLRDQLDPYRLEEQKQRQIYDETVQAWRQRVGLEHGNPLDYRPLRPSNAPRSVAGNYVDDKRLTPEEEKTLLDASDAINQAYRKHGSSRADYVPMDLQEAGRDLFNANQELRLTRKDNSRPTKFDTYALPGEKQNYSELLLRLPQNEKGTVWQPVRADDGTWRLVANQGDRKGSQIGGVFKSEGEAIDYRRAMFSDSAANFKGAHFDEPNILAHVRFDDRTDADGKKTLFVEEVQSDWHQKGKKQGYDQRDLAAERKEVQDRLDEINKKYPDQDGWVGETVTRYLEGMRGATETNQWRYTMPNGRSAEITYHPGRDKYILNAAHGEVQNAHYATLDEAKHRAAQTAVIPPDARPFKIQQEVAEAQAKLAEINRLELNPGMRGVPNAPFKTTWHELALKRMIRYAAENGYDKIGFTTGEQQAERYDLSKRVGSLAYSPDQKRLVAYDPDDKYSVIDQRNVAPEDLADYIGKEPAKRLLESPLEKDLSGGKHGDDIKNAHWLRGQELKIGGEGMKGFYDKIVPDFLNKYGKKWGARVGETKIQTETVTGDHIYTGPTRGADWMFDFAKSHEGTQIYGSAHSVALELQDGRTFEQAMDTFGSEALAEALGGKMEWGKPKAAAVHSLTITPEMKKSVLEGQPLFRQSSLNFSDRTAEAHDQLANEAQAFVVQPANQAPKYVRANPQAMQLLQEANGHRFRGVNMGLGDAYEMIDELRAMRETFLDPRAKDNITNLIETLYKGLHYKNGLNIVKQGPSNASELHTIMEEQIHSGLQRAPGGGILEVPSVMAKDPGIQAMSTRIKGSERATASPTVVVAEGTADILLGDASELSREQAESTAKKYFGLLASQHGTEPLEVARAIYDYADQWAAEHGLVKPGEQYDPTGTAAGRSALNSILARRSGKGTARGGEVARPEGGDEGSLQNERLRPGQGERSPGAPQKANAALRSAEPVGLTDDELVDWSKSRGFRYEPAGEQLGMFGGNDQLVRVFRTGAKGKQERGLVYESQLDALTRKNHEEPTEPFALTGGESQPEEQPRLFGAGDLGEIIGTPQPKKPTLKSSGSSEEKGTALFRSEKGEFEPAKLAEAVTAEFNKEIKPSLEKAGVTFKQALAELQHLIAPRAGVPTSTLDAMMKMAGDRERHRWYVEQALEKAQRLMDKLPQSQQIAFVDRYKLGEAQPTPELNDLSDFMRRTDEDTYRDLVDTQALNTSKQAERLWLRMPESDKVNFLHRIAEFKGDETLEAGPLKELAQALLSYKQDHFRVIWKVVPGRTESTGAKGVRGRRPLEGSRGFLKQSTLDTMSEGIEAGGEPQDYNPVRMFQAAQADAWRYITAQRMWREALDAGERVFVPTGERTPEGFKIVEDRIGNVRFPAASGEGMVEAGHWAMAEPRYRLLRNMLSEDYIRKYVIPGRLMAAKNQLTAWRLGLSPFHVMTTTVSAMAGQVGRGLGDIVSGAEGGQVGRVGRGLAEVASFPVAPIRDYLLGSKMVRYAANKEEFLKSHAGEDFLKAYPEADALLDELFASGAKLTLHEDERMNALQGFRRAMAEHRYLAALWNSPFALNQQIMRPLFGYYIPRLKVASWLRDYSQAKVEHAEDLRAGKMTTGELARQVWDRTENIFGQMNWDARWWDRTFKAVIQLAFRAFTWFAGNIRLVKDAGLGQTKEILESARWWNQRFGGEAEPLPSSGPLPKLDPNLRTIIGLFTVVASVNAALQYALIREGPKDSKDLLAARIGGVDAAGHPRRVVPPAIVVKDYLSLRSQGAARYLAAKVSDLFSGLYDVFRNQDFRGTMIHDPGASFWKQRYDDAMHVIGSPIGISNYLRERKSGVSPRRAALGELGFSPAPAAVSQTRAEKLASQFAAEGHRDYTVSAADREALDARRDILAALRNGDRKPLAEAQRKREITPRQATNLRQFARMTPLQYGVRYLNYPQLKEVYEAASPAEQAELKRMYGQWSMPHKRGAWQRKQNLGAMQSAQSAQEQNAVQ